MSLDDIVKTTRQEIENALGFKTAWFYTLNEDQKYFELQSASDPDEQLGQLTDNLWIEGDSLLEEIVRSSDIVFVDDARTDSRTNKSLLEAFGNRSIFHVPIQLYDRKLGVLVTGTFSDECEYRLTVNQGEYLISLGQCVAIILDRMMSLKQRGQDGEAFRGIEAQLKSSLKTGHISLWEWKLATNRLQFTSKSTDDQELSKSEISFLIKEWKQQMHTDDHPRVEHKLQAFLSGSGKVNEDEFRVLQKDGQHRWVRTQGDLERDDSGRPLHITGYQIDIYERKLMEEALIESETNLRLALKMDSIGLWNWDLVTKKVTFSDEWKQQIGYAADELQDNYESWSSRVHPDDIGTATQNLRSTISDPLLRYETEFRFRHKDGSYRWIHSEGDCLRNVEGQPLSICGCHLDITRLKNKAERLRESESNLRLAMKLGRVGLWSYDLTNEQLQVSTDWYSQIGYSDDELDGTLEELHRMIHPDDVVQAQGRIESFLQNPSNSLKLEYRIQHKNGSYCWVRAEGDLVTDTSNNTVRILGCQLDITQLKQAEETLKLEKNQMRSFILHAPVAMAMLDLKMNYLVTSDHWVKSFSKLGKKLEGLNHYDCNPNLPVHWREAHVKALSGETISKDNDLWMQADGTRVWTNWDARPWYDLEGVIGGIILMDVDITHLKELEDQIVKISTDEQQRIGQDLHDTLSQELTALSMITSELAEVLDSAPSEVVQLVNRIVKGLYRSRNDLRCLMNGLLPITIDCDTSLLNALSDLAILTQDSGKIRCIVESQENFKLADHIMATHLYMIAQEAVHNAVKHANPGTIRIILASDPILRLQIENDSHFIDIQPKDSTNGLGIRIMKNRAAIIGGSLWIEPIKPNGMRVIFQLKGASVE